MELQKANNNMQQGISDNTKKASDRYADIRIALYKKHILLKEISEMLKISRPSVTRTIQGIQWNSTVVDWVRDNLGIILPPVVPKYTKEEKKERRNKNRLTLDPRFKKYFTPKELAFYYGLSIQFLAVQRCHKVGIPYRKLGKKVLYSKEDIDRYIETNAVKIKMCE